MKGHFKRNKLPIGDKAKGFEELASYECFFNGSNQLVVQHPDGPITLVNRPLVDDGGPGAGLVTVFKITLK